MYDSLLDLIRSKMTSLAMPFQPPATRSALADLEFSTRHELSCSLPDEYLAFLSTTDGLNWNGLVVYATKRQFPIEGFVDGNLNYRNFLPMQDYLVFADDGTVLYVYSLQAHKYQTILRVGLTVLESFDSFSAVLFDALKASFPGSDHSKLN